jgi:hypothetical protein
MSGTTDEAGNDRREEILHEELERRLVFFEENDDSVFGEFTTLDWVLCTLLFFALPLLVLGVMVP